MPVRLQRRRTKGYRLPPNAVYVGRPSLWGNPFRVGSPDPFDNAFSAAEAVRLFRALIAADRRFRDFEPLRGHDLACWCPLPCGEPVALYGVAYGDLYDPCAKPKGHEGGHDPSVAPWCHADVLLELANR